MQSIRNFVFLRQRLTHWVGTAVLCLLPLSLTASKLPNPLLTRPAQTEKTISLISNYRYFEDQTLEEADRFDGYGIDFELVVPLNKTMQFRFILPAYTEGRARLLDPPTHERIDIDGYAGTLDLPSAIFEHQLIKEQDAGYNLAYFLGVGTTLHDWGKLDTTHGDRYNHQGILLHYGVQYDRESDDGTIRWLANLGARHHIGSDDINPARTGDNFVFVEGKAAAVFDLNHDVLFPALELHYLGDLDGYNAISMVPQLMAAVHDTIDLKAGVPFRLTHQGERWGFRLQLETHF